MTQKSIPNDEDRDPAELFGDDAAPPTKEDPAPDPFDPESLRLDQGFTPGVKKRQTVYCCRKPGRQEFVRVRPGAPWRLETLVFEDKELRETYLVERSLRSEITETAPVCLFTAISRSGDVFLWPCKMPGDDGRRNFWNESALEAARLAEQKWVRMAANMGAGRYDVFEAIGDLSEPEWPAELTLHELLRLCFKDRFIQSTDHPILRKLRGEI